MIKRNLSLLLTTIAMLITLLNFDYANIDITSKKFWLLIGAAIILIASVLSIFYNESKHGSN